MCGIVGVFNYKSEDRVEEKTLRLMNDTIAHRGPNDEGYYTDNNL